MTCRANPVAPWAFRRLVVTTVLLAIAVVASASLIYVSDAPLREATLPASSALEWRFAPSQAEHLVAEYVQRDAVGDVLRGIAIDTLLLIPSYVALLAVVCFWAARSSAGPWSTVGLALGWSAIVAGALDVIENGGIVAELVLHWSFVAPGTGAACRLKWALVVVSALYAVATPLSRIAGTTLRYR